MQQTLAQERESDSLGITQYRQWRKQHDSPKLATEGQIRRALGRWHEALAPAQLSPISNQATQDSTWDEKDVISWLRAAAGDESTMSHSTYQDWQQQNSHIAKPIHQVMRRFNWAQLLDKAQLQQRYSTRYSNEQLEEALRQAAATLPELSPSAYERWRTQQQEPPPSVETYRKRYRSWQAAATAAGINPS